MNSKSKMKDKVELKKDRYFIEIYNDVLAVEQIIKQEDGPILLQVVIKNAPEIKHFTWFLIAQDINFTRSPLGSGITIFYIDKNVPFFLRKKDKK